MLTEAAPVFARFEGWEFLLHELWSVELWAAFAESAVIESPALTATSKAAITSVGRVVGLRAFDFSGDYGEHVGHSRVARPFI
jgi:hypothetical protein